jgi:hypothetical protein
MVGFGEPVLDAVLVADPAEHVSDEVAGPVALDELNAVVGQNGVHLVGNGLYEHLEEGCGRELGRLAIDAGEHELRSAVDGDEQEALAAFSATF